MKTDMKMISNFVKILVYSKYLLYLCAVIQFVRKYAYVIVLVLIN